MEETNQGPETPAPKKRKPPTTGKPPKRKPGRPKIYDDSLNTATTQKRVESMAGMGHTEQQIADALSIDIKTFRKFFLKAYKAGKTKAVYNVATKVYEKAMAGDGESQRYFLSHRSEEWKDKKQVEVTTPDGVGVLVLPLETED